MSLALPQALQDASLYPGRPGVQLRETHASWVFLAGDHAYKVKKPVRLAFLDYSTLAKRLHACREEVRVNHELAPSIYLGVRAIVRAPGGGLRFAAEEDALDAIEYAVWMRRFDEAHTMQGAIDARRLTRAQVRDTAELLAAFHRRAPLIAAEAPRSRAASAAVDAARAAAGSPAQVLELWRSNVAEIERFAHPADWRPRAMREFGEAFVRAHARELEQRAHDGHVRDGHGDLRCEHVLLEESVRIIDRIEFDVTRRQLDVAGDLAFLAMDLEANRRRWAARELVAAYRHAGGSPGSERLRSFYAAYWALVRAKVALIAAHARHGGERRRERERAARLWRLAERLCWRARQPLVLVVCGAAASGKSTLAAELARRSGLPVVSSDVVRKRLAGLTPAERAGAERYTAQQTRATYEQLGRDALAALDRSGGVIVDASCHSRRQRATLFHRLDGGAATFLVAHCQVPLATALARASARLQSPERISDATPHIVEVQFRRFEPLDELPSASVCALDAEQSVREQARRLAAAVDRRIGAMHTAVA